MIEDSSQLVALPDRDVAAVWRSDDPPPPEGKLRAVDDTLTADGALRRLRRGEWLLYRGNFKNARQLLTALGRRLTPRPRRGAPPSPLETFRAERRQRHDEHETLSRLLVGLDRAARLELSDAPDVAAACRWLWGTQPAPAVLPLKLLLGIRGAFEWSVKGLEIQGLPGRLQPHYGVFTPTRGEYPELLAAIPDPKGKSVFDIGTGTGLLAFLLLARGAARAVGTDLEPAAVACARANAERLGFAGRFEAQARDLFPEGRADLVVCNPPWLPEPPRSRLDRAIFDGDRFLERFLERLPQHLAPGGQGCLLLSNLAVLLGLRPEGFLAERIEAAGLRVAWSREARAGHPRSKDADDPLHELRARETLALYGLAVR